MSPLLRRLPAALPGSPVPRRERRLGDRSRPGCCCFCGDTERDLRRRLLRNLEGFLEGEGALPRRLGEPAGEQKVGGPGR